jgi:signal peptidase II
MIFLLPVLIILLDQYSKYYMSELLELCVQGSCRSIELLPVFQFTLLHNSGAAFSFLSDAGGWQRWFLVAISTSVILFIGVWLYSARHSEKFIIFGLAFILGGAIGNLIDRLMSGYVVDFIVVHWQQYYFPAFNIADSAIFIGACFLILDMIIKPAEKKPAEDSNG